MLSNKFDKVGFAAVGIQIQHNAAFAGVEIEKASAFFDIGLAAGERAKGSAHISLIWAFDLHRVCTQVRQKLRAERSGDAFRQIQNFNSFK